MTFHRHIQLVFWLLLVVLARPQNAPALIMVGRGNAPVQDSGWPQGAVAVANIKSRVGWWEGPPFGGGEWQFLYRGDTAAFENALAAFAAIRARALELVIHDGPEENTFLRDERSPEANNQVDWTFTVWNPERWHMLYNNPKSFFGADQPNFRQPVAPPRLDVYVGGGGVDWTQVKVPAQIRVKDERASAAGLTASAGSVVRADIFDMASGKPIGSARVTVARSAANPQKGGSEYEKVAEGVCDDAGHLQLEKIPAGPCRISVSAAGYASRVLGYEQFGAHALRSFHVELSSWSSLHGVVTDTAGQSLKGVQVRADNPMGIDGRGYSSPESMQTLTDEAGQFELRGLPAGFTQLWASAPGHYFGDVTTLHSVPTTNITLRLSRAGHIHVVVTDREGKALAHYDRGNVMVEIEPTGGARVGSWGGSAEVKPDGTYDFSEVPSGEYRVTSRPNPGTTNKRYAPEQQIKMDPGATVSVRLVYP